MKWNIACIAALGMFLTNISEAKASLSKSYQFNGNGNWTLDAVGGNSTPVGDLDIFVPAGSTIEKAFLYSSATPDQSVNSVGFDGIVLNADDFTSLGINTSGLNLQAFRADVTSQVATKVGNGGGQFIFTIDSENPNTGIDGEVLAVVYSNSNESERTIAFLDGFSDSDGDITSVSFSNPLDTSVPGFEALFSLGIGYGFQGDQASQVDVNGERLTSAAGGQDDGASTNGELITLGGTGDDPSNPDNPNAGPNGDPRFDDELYNLAFGSFLNDGDTTLIINTLNPSNDDNIFFAGLNITAKADVNPGPGPGPQQTPEGSSILGLLAFTTLGLGFMSGKKRS